MPDFPGVAQELPHINLSSVGINSPTGQACASTLITGSAAGIWQSANRALYMPVQIDIPVTVVKMAFQVAVQSGNCDVGIYDEHGNRLVSAGSTVVGVAGIQIIDIADTVLMPGIYFLAMCVDNTTASFARLPINSQILQTCGVQQQAVGAVTLPNPATFANPASSYIPLLVATLVPTI